MGLVEAFDVKAERAFKNIHRELEMEGLSDHLLYIDLKTTDRFFFTALPQLYVALKYRVAQKTWTMGRSSGGPHNMVYQLHPYTGPGSAPWEEQVSFRKVDRPSLQVTIARQGHVYRGDADIDRGNPTMDLLGFFTHVFEVLKHAITKGRTNHEKLAKTVDRRYAAWLKEQ